MTIPVPLEAVRPRHAKLARRRAPRYAFLRTLALGALGGSLTTLAFPPVGSWPFALVGVALQVCVLTAPRMTHALAGAAAGAACFWGIHIVWLTTYLGPAPWAALVALQVLMSVGAAAIMISGWRTIEEWIPGDVTRMVVVPVLVGAAWVGRDFVTGNWPYGGFAWGRIAYSQVDGPLRDLLPWVGVAGTTFAVVIMSTMAVQVARSRRLGSASAPLVLLVVLLAVPSFSFNETGSMRLGAAQGNSDAGIFNASAPGRIFADHVRATQSLYDEDLDLLVWPENSVDVDVARTAEVQATLDGIADRVSAPILFGTLTVDDDQVFNSALVWRAGVGVVEQYDKRYPVPFAEYLPDRAAWSSLLPFVPSLIPVDMTPGTTAATVQVNGVPIGLALCFDIVSDQLVRETIATGAEILIVPSNNADFGDSAQGEQQLSIARARAMETARSVANVSTVGSSAIIGPDGAEIATMAPFTSSAMVAEAPLSDSVTPAMAVAPWFDRLGVGVLVLLFAAGAVAGLSSKSSRRSTIPLRHL